MRGPMLLLGMTLFASIAACQSPPPACPDSSGVDRYLSSEEFARSQGATPVPLSTPVVVEIGGTKRLVAKVVGGPLCNDHWRGNVYVSCDVRVAEWSEIPAFLRHCDLNIEPGTVVYVAAHNDAAYYQGCSCHTDGVAVP